MKSTILLGGCLSLIALAASAQSGESFDLSWSTVDSGGGPSAGGSFSLNGTVGQPDAGAMSGGAFSISSGFWSLPLPGPQPALAIHHGTGNSVILTWPNPSTGYILQQTANMNAPGGGWVDVTQPPVVIGPNKEVTLAATGSFCLFRLRRAP